jgi:hypothetical protein
LVETKNLKGIIMNALIELLKNPPTDMFDAEMFGEWFVNGELEDKHFDRLTPEKVDDTYDSIEERYGLVWAQRFDERALPLVSI